MPLCFAYGSNMDRAAMAVRCPGSRPLGLAWLPRHRLVIMREGYASIARDPRREVLGLLWDVPLADMPALDRYEDVAGGLYIKRLFPVLTEAGPRRALVYVGRNAGPGVPRAGYLEGVLAAAAAAALPPASIARIAELGRLPGPGGPQQRLAERAGLAVAAVRPTRASPFAVDRGRADRHGAWEP